MVGSFRNETGTGSSDAAVNARKELEDYVSAQNPKEIRKLYEEAVRAETALRGPRIGVFFLLLHIVVLNNIVFPLIPGMEPCGFFGLGGPVSYGSCLMSAAGNCLAAVISVIHYLIDGFGNRDAKEAIEKFKEWCDYKALDCYCKIRFTIF